MPPVVRLTQFTTNPGQYRVEVAFEMDGIRQTADVHFDFDMSDKQREDLRWYFEDFPQYPEEPNIAYAQQVEREIVAIGIRLFRAIFESSGDARDLWASIRDRLADTRIEVITDVAEAATIPWELLRDPKTDMPFALQADSFVRAYHRAAQRPRLLERDAGPVRILLAICRPGGELDVSFRSVANRLLTTLQQAGGSAFRVDVLRPPTYEQLSLVLHAAKDRGEPYHIVHFDGHGSFGEVAEVAGRPAPLTFAEDRPGLHGYLLLESPDANPTGEPVDGPTLGRLLVATRVPVLVLNACRSAQTQAPDESVSRHAGADPHAQVRSFGSLAQEVMDAGVGGVVAMRYTVYIDTAARFIADLYSALARGLTLGTAVSRGRQQLAAQPKRTIAADPVSFQDWPVPVVYEAAPVALFAREQTGITRETPPGAARWAELAFGLPAGPDGAFHGRDEVLLALDRAFDQHQVVLLHGVAGAGKTATAVEFARWYAFTGGAPGPVLFTAFRERITLSGLLDRQADAFKQELTASHIAWSGLTAAERRSVALQLLNQRPLLWVWDGVEQVQGFPPGSPSRWAADEQWELVQFLRAAAATGTRFLLTSRTEESQWLGDLPVRIVLGQMPNQDAISLLRALAAKRGRKNEAVPVWAKLLRYAEGNPGMLQELVNQALAREARSARKIEEFLEPLRSLDGESGFATTLPAVAAALDYGFRGAFSEAETRVIALLRLFHRFVNVEVFRNIGDPAEEWHVPELDLTPAQADELFERAAAAGLLWRVGPGGYALHPGLPAYLAAVFAQYHPDESAIHAFVRAMSDQAQRYAGAHQSGQRVEVEQNLIADEANLLAACSLARNRGWWDLVLDHMKALHICYRDRDKYGKWTQLVQELMPSLLDFRPGRTGAEVRKGWTVTMMYIGEILMRDRHWKEAEEIFATLAETVDFDAEHIYSALGDIALEQLQADCAQRYVEALAVARRVDDVAAQSRILLRLGNVYLRLTKLRDLDKAASCYEESLRLCQPHDDEGRAMRLAQLGKVALAKAQELAPWGYRQAVVEQISKAEDLFRAAEKLMPEHAFEHLSKINHSLGDAYAMAGNLEKAMPHLQAALQYKERAGDLLGATRVRMDIAHLQCNARRYHQAMLYIQKALSDLQGFPPEAEVEGLQKGMQGLAYELKMRQKVDEIRGKTE